MKTKVAKDKRNAALGARIKEVIKMRGVTNQFVAQHCGVSQQQLHKQLQGNNRISVTRLYDIADCLGVSVEYFLLPEKLFQTLQTVTPHQEKFDRLPEGFQKIINDLMDVMLAQCTPGFIVEVGRLSDADMEKILKESAPGGIIEVSPAQQHLNEIHKRDGQHRATEGMDFDSQFLQRPTALPMETYIQEKSNAGK